MALGVNSGIGYDPLSKKLSLKPAGIGAAAGAAALGTKPSDGIMNTLNNQSNGARMGRFGLSSNQQPVVRTAIDDVKAQMKPQSPAATGQFSYDPKTDPVYQRALEQAGVNATAASGDAMAALNKRGILDSTITSDRVAGIQQDAISNVETNLMPQLAQQAFQRYQDSENQKNQADQLALQQGQLTGYYQTPEMKQQYAIVDQAKQDYANAKTPEERIAAHQRAESARGALDQMNANSGLVGSDVTLDQARGNSAKYGVQTLEGQRSAYDMSANNPANQALTISNKIDQLKLDNLPKQMKLELEQLQQQVKAGKIDLDTAEHNLDELTNPNSVTNQSKKLQLDMTKIDAKNYSIEAKLKLEQLRKTVDQIGKEPALTENEKAMQGIELEKARIELQNLKDGKPNKPVTADDMRNYFDSMVQRNNDNQITNPTDLERAIVNSDLSEYDVYQMYLRYGLKWEGNIPKPGK